MTQRTPGPWAIRFEGSRGQEIIVRSTVEIDDPFDGGKIEPLVADLFRGGPGNIADARLIAAAPELLKLCKELLDEYEGAGYAACPHLIADAKRVMAAAEGADT